MSLKYLLLGFFMTKFIIICINYNAMIKILVFVNFNYKKINFFAQFFW